MAYELRTSFNDLMNVYCKHHKIANKQEMKKAYEYAAAKHFGVFRGSGEPYINHPLRVAKLLAEWGFESDVLISALLHDVVEDCDTPLEEIDREFGTNVSKIVDAVTALSDRDFENPNLTKVDKDRISDVNLQKKINEKALYVKIADRIDNLSTMSGVKEEKKIPKAEHTREIIIPLAKMENAYYLIDILEELCFQIEHPKMYTEIDDRYIELCEQNIKKCNETLDILSTAFDPNTNYEGKKVEKYHRLIKTLHIDSRSCISIYRHISRAADNISVDFHKLLNKENIPLWDLTVVLSDELETEYADITPNEVFLKYYEIVLAEKGINLLGYRHTTHGDAAFFIVSDVMDNMFRVFVRTEKSYQRYLFGNIIDEDYILSISDINETDPRDTYNEKIKVFRKDGTGIMIDKDATVLDFAFYIHSELGYHFNYALLDESKTQLPAYTRLNEGDTITIVANEEIIPSINWFKYIKTSRATALLVHWFQKNDIC